MPNAALAAGLAQPLLDGVDAEIARLKPPREFARDGGLAGPRQTAKDDQKRRQLAHPWSAAKIPAAGGRRGGINISPRPARPANRTCSASRRGRCSRPD